MSPKKYILTLAAALFALVFSLMACGGNGGDDTVHVTGVTLNQTEVTLAIGGAETLIPTVQPADATNQAVSWSSNNTSVATVSGGLVTAVADGTAMITVTTQDGGVTATCLVTVGATPTTITGILLNKNTMILAVGGSETLMASVQPSNAVNKAVSWSSNNTSVATVSGGIVTAISAGTATIAVTTQDGGHTASCVVTVDTVANIMTDVWVGTSGGLLRNGEYVHYGAIRSVFVSDGDVYATGAENHDSVSSFATLWKNGVPQRLSDGTHHAVGISVFVSGNDVYVAGQDNYAATLWKNGVPQRFAGNLLNSVFVSGNDVYVASGVGLWKNGVQQKSYGDAFSVFVSGDDVYVAGVELQINPATSRAFATLWKNGAVQRLSDGTYSALANSVFVSGNDVYVAGEENRGTTAILWKNGVLQRLNDGVGAKSVFISGEDVYVVGHKSGGIDGVFTYGAVLWKNGAPQTLDGHNVANSVFVSNRPASGYVPVINVEFEGHQWVGIRPDEQTTYKAKVLPSDASNKNIIWSSSNTGVATINADGVVTPLRPGGTTTIMATAEDGGHTASLDVLVIVLGEYVTLDKTTMTLAAGDTETLKAAVMPEDATHRDYLSWRSSNAAVATVDQNGLVTAVAAGTATITVTNYVLGVNRITPSASCAVTVVPATGKQGVQVGNFLFIGPQPRFQAIPAPAASRTNHPVTAAAFVQTLQEP